MSYYKGSKYINQKIIPLAKKTSYLLKTHGYQVHFMCNDEAYKEFKEVEWDYIDSCLNDLNPEYRCTWSLSKIEAYKRCCEYYDKFYHVDLDVFIFEPLEQKSLEKNIIIQSKESLKRYSKMLRLQQNCGFLPQIFDIPIPDVFYNMGFFGGKSTSLKPIVDSCLEFIYHPNNKDFFTSKKYYDTLTQALLAEQGFFGYYVNYYNIPVHCIRDYSKDYYHYGFHKSMSNRINENSLKELKLYLEQTLVSFEF
jgi:hypothetical protein